MNDKQKILVFQQNGSGEAKIRGIIEHGQGAFALQRLAVEAPLPPLIEDARDYLPAEIHSDLVLDYMNHPDLSHDLAVLCRQQNIPVVAAGKKLHCTGALTPPT